MDDIHFMRKTAHIKKASANDVHKLDSSIKEKKIGVFLHIFYPELAPTIAGYLEKIPTNIDIYISTNQGSIDKLKEVFGGLDLSLIHI